MSPLFVTTTAAAPAVPAGVTAVTSVALTRTTAVAGCPPIVTVGLAANPVPAMAIEVPPAVDPDVGLTAEIVGAASGAPMVT